MIILVIQISLGVLFALFVALTFMAGFRYGVDVTVNVYLDEKLREHSQSNERHEYIAERKGIMQKRRDPYHDWRRKYNLPDNSATRALFADTDYRAKQEAQDKP